MVIAKKFIRSVGGLYASQNLKAVWVSKIWPCSMMLSWPSKLGGFFITKTPSSTGFLNPSSSLMAQLWMLRSAHRGPMLGRAC